MMKNFFSKKIIPVLFSLILIGGTFVLGFYFGQNNKPETDQINLLNKESSLIETIDFGPFWKTWNLINEKYVDKEEIVSDQKKVWGAIQGLASSLDDPYTVFLPPEESEIFEGDISGNFSGVGMEVGIQDNIITIVAPLKDTPAEKAGIKAGDKIVKIDGESTINFSLEKAVGMIRGEKGTPVKITVSRKGVDELIEITIVRDNIKIPTIKTEIKDDVFIISLYNFSAVSANLFKDALREYYDSKKPKLILDLRGNPGGYMEAAIDMASWFLPAGKVIVRESFGGDIDERVHRSKGYDIFNNNLKFAILIDIGSASASEILAGALREHDKAILVGTRTFGKGSVQELIKITPDTSLKITIARWLTPNGVSISKDGLTPDYEVSFTPEDLEAERDPQLEKAIEILSN